MLRRINHAVAGGSPLRNQVMAVCNDAIQGAAGGQQLGTAFGCHHFLYQRIDGGAFDASLIARIWRIGGQAAKHFGIFLPWIVAAAVGYGGEVKVKFLQALLIEGKVGRANLQHDAELG